jgi:hypothetical protein
MKPMPRPTWKRFGLPLLMLCVLIAGCSPPSGTVGVLYTWSMISENGLTVTTPPGIAAPAWATATVAPTSVTISGTPSGNDFGDFPVSGAGTYNGWFTKGKAWSYSGNIHIAIPTASAPPVTLHTTAAGGVTATITGSPAAIYTFGVTTKDVDLTFPTSVTSNAAGVATFTIGNNSDVPRKSALTITISPTGANAAPVLVTLTVNIVAP